MDLKEWGKAYDEAMAELERRLADKCRLLPPSKIPEIIRAVHKVGTIGLQGPDGSPDIVVKHTVYEYYGEPFLEFKAILRSNCFDFIIRNIAKEEKDGGIEEGEGDDGSEETPSD